MITTAIDRLTVMIFGSILSSICGTTICGSPLLTSDRHTIPYSSISITQDSNAPAAMTHIAIGNFGMNLLETSSTARAVSPMIIDGTFTSPIVSAMCSTSSNSSPVPAPAP